jgi:hypothetical protein
MLEQERTKWNRAARKAVSRHTVQQVWTWPEQGGDWLAWASTIGPANGSLGGRPLRGSSSNPATPSRS